MRCVTAMRPFPKLLWRFVIRVKTCGFCADNRMTLFIFTQEDETRQLHLLLFTVLYMYVHGIVLKQLYFSFKVITARRILFDSESV